MRARQSFFQGKEPVEAFDKPLTLMGGFAFLLLLLFLESKKKKPTKRNKQTKKTNPEEVLYSITKYKYDSLAGRSPGSAAFGG